MRVLVTGGTGFLGQNIVTYLQMQGHCIRVLGRDETVCAQLTAGGVEVVRADLRDGPAVRNACANMDAVCHAGALSAPWGRLADFHASNVVGTENVLAGCKSHHVKRLVFISSPSVTFAGRDLHEATEASPYPPRYLSPYSLTKKQGEDLVNAAHRGGLATVILRPKALFGPGDRALLPRLLTAAHRGRLPQIGAGRNLVDLTYVENAAQAVVLALTAEAAVGKTYIVTNDEHVPLWDVIRLVLRRLGVPARLRPMPYHLVYALAAMMEFRSRLLGGEPTLTRYTTAILGRTQTYDVSAAKRDLGYQPTISVAEGVERTLAAYHEAPVYV
jgi:2-alkyl-3-oxoalkanoate reductase